MLQMSQTLAKHEWCCRSILRTGSVHRLTRQGTSTEGAQSCQMMTLPRAAAPRPCPCFQDPVKITHNISIRYCKWEGWGEGEVATNKRLKQARMFFL